MTALPRRHPGALAGLLAAAAVAWWWTARRMARMDAGPATELGSLGWFTVTWLAMMAAMMLPSLAPALGGAGARGPRRWALFVGGYLLAWCTFGVGAYALLRAGRAYGSAAAGPTCSPPARAAGAGVSRARGR